MIRRAAIVFFIGISLGSMHLIAQDSSDAISQSSSKVASQNEVSQLEEPRIPPIVPSVNFSEFNPTLDTITRHIKSNQISPAISQLISLIHQLQQRLELSAGLFFPSNFQGFSSHENKLPSGIDDQTHRFGVLFERHYKDTEGNTIDINAIYDSGSISDYIAVIKNPRLLRNLENTTIVKVQDKYDAIEKFSPGESYHERNILISNQLLVNIVILGKVDEQLMNEFCNASFFEELNLYLTSQDK